MQFGPSARRSRHHRAAVDVDITADRTVGVEHLVSLVRMSSAAAVEWQRRVAAEYAICWLSQEVAQRLTLIGAPPELIHDALVMALDELEHARLAATVAAALGVRQPSVFDPDAFIVEQAPTAAANLAVVIVPSLCLGETLAIRLNQLQYGKAEHVEARQALARAAADEPRHAALGWAILDLLLDNDPTGEARPTIAQRLPRWIASLRAMFDAEHALPHLTELAPADVAWGLADPEESEAAMTRVAEQAWQPRLARRGFTT